MPGKTKSYHINYQGSCWFNMVKIIDESQKGKWINYASSAGNVGPSSGISTFQQHLENYSNQGTEVWVACVSQDRRANPEKDIEMYMSVTTSTHLPFTSHMGIQRVPCGAVHQNISVPFHSFCARVMLEMYPDKDYMINAPMPLMRKIIYDAFTDNGERDAISTYYGLYNNPLKIGDCIIHQRYSKECIDDEKSRLEELKALGRDKITLKQAEALIYRMEVCEEELVKIEKGEKKEILKYNKDIGEITLLRKDRNEIKFNAKTDEECSWFLSKDMSCGFGAGENSFMIADLAVLSTLSGDVASAELICTEFLEH